jgi:glycosyltransferase involved in cell wall biosynthesis
VRVLYVSHTAVVSGGERSLLDMLAALDGRVDALLATPPGQLQALAESRGIRTTPITGTAGSLRLHPAHTPRAIAEMTIAALQVRRAAARHRAELVHANSIRAGIVLALARVRRTPTIVHVRDCLPPGRVSAATLRLLANTATTIVANSHYTAASVRAMAPTAQLEVVHNAVDLERFDPARIDRAAARRRLGLSEPGPPLLGVVAQISPWKGHETAIGALRLLRAAGVDAKLLLVGGAKFVSAATRYDNEAYLGHLQMLVADAGLQDSVSWLGERDDVPEIVRALDVLLLPSWEEPFGRALVEAMALEVPVVATAVGGPNEIVEDGREGYLVAPRQPQAWADAIGRVLSSPDLAAAMGRAGRSRVEREFTFSRQSSRLLDVYSRTTDRGAERGS